MTDLRAEVVDAATTTELRRTVLRPQWPAGAFMPGDDATDAVHLALFDGHDLVSTCVLLPRPYPLRPAQPHAWQLRGMATAAHRTGEGLGSALLRAVDVHVVSRGGRLVWCDARSSARSFYERNGFHAEGDEFVHADSGLPHFRMWREPDPGAASSIGVAGIGG